MFKSFLPNFGHSPFSNTPSFTGWKGPTGLFRTWVRLSPRCSKQHKTPLVLIYRIIRGALAKLAGKIVFSNRYLGEYEFVLYKLLIPYFM